jgi:uncharacterized integral membrane protein
VFLILRKPSCRGDKKVLSSGSPGFFVFKALEVPFKFIDLIMGFSFSGLKKFMFSKWKVWIVFLILTLVLNFIIENVKANSGEIIKLFMDIQLTPQLLVQQEKEKKDPAIIRSRYVHVNFDLIKGKETQIVLNLFSDASFNVIKDRVEDRSANKYTWFGHAEGKNSSQVILVVEDGNLAGNILITNELYQIRPIGNGIHAIYKIDQSLLPPP